MELKALFNLIVAYTIVQRVAELLFSKKNESQAESQGGKVLKEKNYIWMVLFHVSWFLFLLLIIFTGRVFIEPPLFFVGLFLFFIGQVLRASSIFILKDHWSTKVMVFPKSNVVDSKFLHYIRHPNYLGVVFEIFALPLMVGQWEAGIFFSLLNGVILFYRIRFEEAMLSKYSNYEQIFSKGSV